MQKNYDIQLTNEAYQSLIDKDYARLDQLCNTGKVFYAEGGSCNNFLAYCIEKNDAEALNILIENWINIDVDVVNLYNPLEYCIEHKADECIQTLLDFGFDRKNFKYFDEEDELIDVGDLQGAFMSKSKVLVSSFVTNNDCDFSFLNYYSFKDNNDLDMFDIVLQKVDQMDLSDKLGLLNNLLEHKINKQASTVLCSGVKIRDYLDYVRENIQYGDYNEYLDNLAYSCIENKYQDSEEFVKILFRTWPDCSFKLSKLAYFSKIDFEQLNDVLPLNFNNSKNKSRLGI